jgi:pimeloyl-ACP methyl ester carboxylesterase
MRGTLPTPRLPALQAPLALRDLLAAAGERGPFVVAGHSVGGQLALQFGALFPNDTAGVALVDSYADAAINLQLTGRADRSFTGSPGMLFTLNILRAVTPFAWGRLITQQPPGYKYAPALSALYGGNKAWQSQWVEVLGIAAGNGVGADLARLAGNSSQWHGAGWPSYGSKPLLLMPAAQTLEGEGGVPPGCGLALASNASCQAAALAAPRAWYAKLYLAYQQSLSSNTTLLPVPGGHGATSDSPQLLADALLAKFAGV